MSTPLTARDFLRSAWRWQKGRQGTGYEKCLLLTGLWPMPFDLYLLRYRAGQGIPPHTDPTPGKRHYRANLVLTQGQGGKFVCADPLYTSERLHVFRSDLSVHAVEPVTNGTRYVLSLGWLRKAA